jgi:hypothetical protein
MRHRATVKISNNAAIANQAELMQLALDMLSSHARLWIPIVRERRFISAGSFDALESMLLTF